ASRFATRPYRRIGDDRRKPLARYGAMESALRERLAPSELHHQLGHDPPQSFKLAGASLLRLMVLSKLEVANARPVVP
ncbi:MAG TPA: hypothetical protein VMI72_14440, partial [Roseiarcus sp.]|nr:hypothetical protein [Roseiarcus sp.]